MIVPTDRPPGTMILLDPFSDSRQELSPSFPDAYAQDAPARWENFTVVIYEPSLEKVAYLRDTFSDEGLGIVLLDLQSNRALWQLNHTSASIVTPKWSPDGEQLTVAEPTTINTYHFEILSVDSQGKVTQLTNLTEIYSVTLIGDFNWSPDGRFIAFWFEDRPTPLMGDGLERLLVLDTTGKKITDTCIPGSVLGSSIAPIWSPDGRYIVVENIYKANAIRVLLVDTQENMAWQIAENQRPAGWMTEIQ
jgi:Tol biopolymer transport system component